MADRLLSEEGAREWLARCCALAGGANKLAMRAGVSPAFVSMMLNGRKQISGKVATHIGLKKVNSFELTLVPASPKQQQYENARRLWAEQNESFFARYSRDAIALAEQNQEAAAHTADERTSEDRSSDN